MSSLDAAKSSATENEARVSEPLIATLLSEFERREAEAFQRRTGLDYKATVADVIAAAELQLGMRVLDVATGTGVIARQLIGQVGEKGKIIGVDATDEMVQKARLAAQSAGVGRKIEWRVAAAESLPFARDEFDLVTCTMALQRLRVDAFLREAYRVLKPGCRLVIATELSSGTSLDELKLKLLRGYRQILARGSAEANVKYPLAKEVAELIKEAGFRQCVTRILRQPGRYPTIFSLISAVK